ncbi:hypothetical protein JCM11641_000022 [Rhodosporidiobolus odoratus]
MSRRPPLQLGGAVGPAHTRLQTLKEQLDQAIDVAHGARAAIAHLAEGPHPDYLPGALEDALAGAERDVKQLEDSISQAELQAALLVPTPLSPPQPPASAVTNGFVQQPVPTPTSQPSSFYPLSAGFSPSTSFTAEPDFHATFGKVLDLLGRLGSVGTVSERVRAMDSVVEAVERFPNIKLELRLDEQLSSIFACLSESAGKETRAAVYRLLRHLVVDASDAFALNQRQLPLFLIRTLVRDSTFNLEKEHALRLIRILLPFASPESTLDGDSILPVSVVRAVVAIAETVEEKLRLAALGTLGELVILNLPLLSLSGGLRVVLQTFLEGPYDLSPPISLLFIPAMDLPASRQWLRPGVDLEVVLAGFTEQTKATAGEERVKACANIVSGWLKTWSGLFYLNVHGRQALTSLVDSLTNPSKVIRESLLDMLFSIFNVNTNPRHLAKSNSGNHPSGRLNDKIDSRTRPPPDSERKTNLLDQYMAILLLVFIEAGLAEALTSLAADPKDPATATKVFLLISEILELGNRVLPPQHSVRLQALPRLFALTASFDASDTRLAASDTLLAVHAHDRDRRGISLPSASGVLEESRPRYALPFSSHPSLLVKALKLPSARVPTRSTSLSSTNLTSTSLTTQFFTAKLHVALQMDDQSFRSALLSTGVLSTKDHAKWNLTALQALVDGPLKSPKRLEETMKASNFMRRLLGFFQPFALRYCEMPKTADTERWTRLGCSLVETLLGSADGAQYLSDDKLLRQISDCLFQLDPQLTTATGAETLFSPERMEKTLVGGYFDMLGVLTRSEEGVRTLDQFKFFTAFYRISELRSREDLVKAIIENVDYSLDGHSRVFLAKALTSNYKPIRLFATQHLSSLLSSSTSDGPLRDEWKLALLVQQLYDSAPEVARFALHKLEEVCQNRETLELVVRKRPALDLLGGRLGEGLLIRFLSIDEGVRYLHEIDFVEQELEVWFNERNVVYVVELELALASALGTDGHLRDSPPLFDGTPPRHFYGELVKTSEGCDILEESGHLDHFVEVIMRHGEVQSDEAYVVTLKSVLWAVGHIGSSAEGLALLDEQGVLTDLVQIAAFSPVYSLRGTATYSLALISQTDEGAELLEELGWESVYSPVCGPTGICVPMYLGDYIFTPLWDPPERDLPNSLSLASPTSPHEREALTALSNLSNHILAAKASKTLARLKTRHRHLFSSPALLYRALDMIGSHQYRLATRKYVVELFDLQFDSDGVERIAQAGKELKARKLAELEEAEEEDGYGEGQEVGLINGRELQPTAPSWRKSGVETILGARLTQRGGITDDDDESGLEDGDGTTIPLQVLAPIVTVQGFLLA